MKLKEEKLINFLRDWTEQDLTQSIHRFLSLSVLMSSCLQEVSIIFNTQKEITHLIFQVTNF